MKRVMAFIAGVVSFGVLSLSIATMVGSSGDLAIGAGIVAVIFGGCALENFREVLHD